MQLQYSWIRSFHYAARYGSLSAAAEHLGLASSTLSHQIKDLEGDFKVKLFYRHGNKIYLTNIGLSLKKITDSYFETENDIKSFLAKVKNRVNKVINIGAENPMKVIPLMDQVRKKNENIEINLFFEKNDLLLEMFMKNKVDLLMINRHYFEENFTPPTSISQISTFPANSTSPGMKRINPQVTSSSGNPLIDAIHFYNDRLVLAVHEKSQVYTEFKKLSSNTKSNSESFTTPLSWETLLQNRFILPHKSSAARIYFERICNKFGFFPHEVLEISSREGVVTAVKNNLGIGVVLESEIIGRTHLYALPLPQPADLSKGSISNNDLTVEEYVYYNHNISDLAVMKKFIKIIKSYSFEDFQKYPDM